MKTEKVSWRGTPGVGDFMWALSCCHNYALEENIQVELEMHWEHDEDYYHHFEDPETIIERMDYIHNFYHDKDRVKVIHVFNSNGRYSDWKFDDDVVLEPDGTKRISATKNKSQKNRFWFESGKYSDEQGGNIPNNNWLFRGDSELTRVDNRMVIWRPFFNAETPRTWKRIFTNSDWELTIEKFKKLGFHVHEITYRTPVREAMYLIRTSRLVLCYDGMWHYIAKLSAAPMGVISSEGVTTYHTPNALKMKETIPYEKINVWWYIDNPRELLGITKRKSLEYKQNIIQTINSGITDGND